MLLDHTPVIGVGIDAAERFACLPVMDSWDQTQDLALSALATTRWANEQKCFIFTPHRDAPWTESLAPHNTEPPLQPNPTARCAIQRGHLTPSVMCHQVRSFLLYHPTVLCHICKPAMSS